MNPPKEPSRHEAFYRTYHGALVAYLTQDQPAIAVLQTRFAAHAGTWTRALCCGYYRAAHLHRRLPQSGHDFYALAGSEFLNVLLPQLASEHHSEPDAISMLAGFEAVQAYDRTDQALPLAAMCQVAEGLAMLLITHEGFVSESDRERVLETLSFEVAEDVLGDWPR